MQGDPTPGEGHERRLTLIREETRFEVGSIHDRVNALIGAESFLMIAFVLTIVNSDGHWSARYFALLAPMLSTVGFVLAALAWLGIGTTSRIVVEWNDLLSALLDEAPAASRSMWRPSALRGGRQTAASHGRSMLFARAVPVVFAAVWAVLTVAVLVIR